MAKFISLFAGVGGFDLGMEKAGHECVAQVEWDKNAAGVLKHRWPNVPLFCDVSKVTADDLPDADFITYGFPCQDLSVAGKREGLDGKRSGLFFESTRLIRELRARGCGLRFAVAENVAGLFSADDGVAFARCIRELLDCGACETGWRLLDSQYFGVAQRRKRVFIVSDFGGESVDEILAITESLPGHPPPSREAGKGTAGDARSGFTASSFGGYGNAEATSTLRNQGGDLGGGSEALITEGNLVLDKKPINLPESDIVGTLSDGAHMGGGLNGQDAYTGRIMAVQSVDWYNQTTNPNINHTLGVGGDVPEVIEQKETYCLQGGGETSQSQQGSGVNKDVSFTLNGLDKHGVAYEDKKSMSFAPSDITRGFGQKPEVELSGTLKKNHNDNSPHVVTSQQGGEGVGVAHSFYPTAGRDFPLEKELSLTVKCGSSLGIPSPPGVLKENLTVRRLTPIECERLQGFPDNWTSEKMEVVLEGNEWKATGKVLKQADGPRYKQMGNAVTVNVAEWIGKQIGKVLNENNI